MATASEPAATQAAPDRSAEEALWHARSYAKEGFYVLPWHVEFGDDGKVGKVPSVKAWELGIDPPCAPPDPGQVEKWFGPGGRFHGSNIGIATGWRWVDDGPVPFAVEDVDGEIGGESWARLLADLQLTPGEIDTWRAQTQGGGTHYLFQTQRPVKNGVSWLPDYPKIDVRGVGGFIAVAPSIAQGRPYAWLKLDGAMLVMPEALEALQPRPSADTKPVDCTPLSGVDPKRAEDRARAWLATAPAAVEGQAGDQTTFKTAARLKDFGCSQAQTLQLLWEEWNDRCSPPWEPDSLEAKVAHAYRYGQEPQGSSAPEAIFTPILQPDETDPAPKPKRPAALEVLRWSELKDTPVPEVQWIWKPFFPRVSFGALVSHPGHGKSWLSLQIAVAVATGLPIFGQPTCGPAGAGVLALEDDKHVLHRRLKAIREGYGLAWTADHDVLLDQNLVAMVRARAPLEGLGQAAAAHELAHLAKELGSAMANTQNPPAVLFLDTLNAIHSGDENSNTETRQLAATIFSIGDTLNCSVWALHHLRKTGTGKNATALVDRMNPELVRGASAIVGSTRAVAQFGWITSNEAGKAGLDPEGAERRYAILGLTKINDGPLSPWLLIEHQRSNGLMVSTLDGEKALATLRGGNATAALKKSEALLVDLYEMEFILGGIDRPKLIAKHFPDKPKGADSLRDAISDLRKRQGWVKTGVWNLTEEGIKKALELKGGQTAEDSPPEESDLEE